MLAALAFAVTVATPYRPVGFALVALTLASVGYTYLKGSKANRSGVHLILAGAVIPQYAQVLPDFPDPSLLVTTVLLLALVSQEGLLVKLERPRIRYANLGLRNPVTVVGRRTTALNSLILGLLLAATIARIQPWIPAVAVSLTLGVVFGAALLSRRKSNGHEAAAVRLRLEKAKPVFALHYSAPAGSEFQVTMWLPYLERLELPYMIILREPDALAKLAKLTKAPIVVAPSMDAVEQAIVPTLTTIFYVNNGMKNTHCVRFAHLTHVQLLHGDSEKPPSFNPVTAMFDRIFVAGQAAIDRYRNNGVEIQSEKFTIVGRPQVESIDVAAGEDKPLSDKVVLYAPTWVGYYSDTNYCSLPVARRLLEHVLELGATVIFRPHPYTAKDAKSAAIQAELEQLLRQHQAATGRNHLWGKASTEAMSIVDCFNASDVLIADVSSSITDFLYSEKPFAVVDMMGEGDGFVETFPLAEGAYVLRNDLSNLEQAMSELLVTDPKGHIRRSLKGHYLGNFPAETYVEGFVEAAHQIVLTKK